MIISLPLHPVDMTPEVMQRLEKGKRIVRLFPGHDKLDVDKGKTVSQTLYEAADGYGPHQLLSIHVNREGFPAFGWHPGPEEFWLIGNAEAQPLYLAIAWINADALAQKAKERMLIPDDFILLRVRYNDPHVSFFIMPADVPHGECIVDRQKPPAVFYVTESRDLPLHHADLGAYRLEVADKPQ